MNIEKDNFQKINQKKSIIDYTSNIEKLRSSGYPIRVYIEKISVRAKISRLL
jgi:hypothetical protein